MGLPCRLLLALLLSAICCHCAAGEQQHGGWSIAAQQDPPPPLDSVACALAGGWCPPAHEAAPPGGHSNGTSAEPGPEQRHKELWPLNGADWVGLGAAAVALLLSATGGLGGGAILVPLYLMVLGELLLPFIFYSCCSSRSFIRELGSFCPFSVALLHARACLHAASLPTPNLRPPPAPTHHFRPPRLLHGRRGGTQQHHHRGRHAGQPGIQHCQGALHGRAPRVPPQRSSARRAAAWL